jgi:riboflavin synthase
MDTDNPLRGTRIPASDSQSTRAAAPWIGVVDTTFSRVDMGRVALDTLATEAPSTRVVRRTVPGIKDLAAACRRFFDEGADAVIACGMVGPEEVDKTCGHEASLGLMALRVHFGRPLLEVFVHMDEVKTDEKLRWLAEERTREHALNCAWMLHDPDRLVKMAGTGQRQGFPDAGPIERTRPSAARTVPKAAAVRRSPVPPAPSRGGPSRPRSSRSRSK